MKTNIFGSDGSPRTSAIIIPFWISIVCAIVFTGSMIGYFVGASKYNNIVAKSSTPIGTELSFTQSGASLTLNDIYLDKNDDVMIARLAMAEQANDTLPYKGTDYSVYVKNEQLGDFEHIPVLWGKMSTDGDMILVLPKPNDSVYTIAVVNNKFNSTSKNGTNNDIANERITDLSDRSIAESLSEFTNEPDVADDGTSSVKVNSQQGAGATHDIMGFRLTKSPAFDEPEYQPTRLNEDLYDDTTKEFDFETFFNKVYIGAAIDKLTKQYNDFAAEIEQQNLELENAQTRQANNPNDKASIQRVTDAENRLDKLKKTQQEVADKLTYYSTLPYDPGLFQNFQNSAKVVEKF